MQGLIRRTRMWAPLILAVPAAGAIAMAGGAAPALADTAPAPVCANGTCTVTFLATDSAVNWAVPAGVTSAEVTLYGANGGAGGTNGGAGGRGAEVTGSVALSGMGYLTVNVGTAGNRAAGLDSKVGSLGGYGGGGFGGATALAGTGGGGGGATTVADSTGIVLVAGGGGGGGAAGKSAAAAVITGGSGGNANTAGGAGGTYPCGGSTHLPGGSGGGPGTPSAGGTGGAGGTGTSTTGATGTGGARAGCAAATGSAGQSGAFSQGGGGGTAGGGGGGGYYGGGQGGQGAYLANAAGAIVDASGYGGGGGGSSFGGVVVNNPLDPGLSGDGEAILTYANPVVVSPAYTDSAGQTLAGNLAPAGDAVTPAVGETTAAGGTVTVNADGSFSYSPPSGTFSGADSFQYTVTDAEGDYATDTATILVGSVADLSVSVGTNSNSTKTNAQLTYTITVTNNGPSSADHVLLNDTLSAQTTFVSAVSSLGSCVTPAAGATGTLSCDLASVPSGTSATIQVVVTTIAKKGTVTNTASVSSTTADPNTANNTASISTLVK